MEIAAEVAAEVSADLATRLQLGAAAM